MLEYLCHPINAINVTWWLPSNYDSTLVVPGTETWRPCRCQSRRPSWPSWWPTGRGPGPGRRTGWLTTRRGESALTSQSTFSKEQNCTNLRKYFYWFIIEFLECQFMTVELFDYAVKCKVWNIWVTRQFSVDSSQLFPASLLQQQTSRWRSQ